MMDGEERPVLTQFVGLAFLLYGIIKFIIFLAIQVIPPRTQERLSKVQVLNILVSGDRTFAGRTIDFVLFIFAIFSMVHGLALMNSFPPNVDAFIESHTFQYTFYAILGIFMILFYTIVLYTDIPIPKKKENYNMYWIYGYLIGATFIAIPVIWELAGFLIPAIKTMSAAEQLMIITVLFFIAFIILMYAYYVYTKRMRKHEEAKAAAAAVKK